MIHTLRSSFVTLFAPQAALQVAAICLRETLRGDEVLLITSRGTGRWVVPKGWPMSDRTNAEAALQEAWEEAGFHAADIGSEPFGHFRYDKGLDDGRHIPVRTECFLARVRHLREDFPEAAERERQWFTLKEAANRVREPDLTRLLLSLEN